MRIECDFMYIKLNGKRTLYDASGNPVDLNELLKQYKLDDNDGVPVGFVVDDGRHEEIPFSLGAVRSILAHKTKGYFGFYDGRKATVYNAYASGDYPIIGQDAANRPCLWDKNGNEKDGDELLRLHVFQEIEPSPAPEKPAESPTPEEARADEADSGGSPLDEMNL